MTNMRVVYWPLPPVCLLLGELTVTEFSESSESSGRLQFRLAYGDCDAVGIAYFAMYYPWMERAYTSWLYSHGIRAGEMLEELDVFTVGMRSQCRYYLPVRVFDVLTCQVTRDHIGTTSYQLGFDFLRDDEVVTHGEILFACRDRDGGKAPMPEPLLAALQQLPTPVHPDRRDSS